MRLSIPTLLAMATGVIAQSYPFELWVGVNPTDNPVPLNATNGILAVGQGTNFIEAPQGTDESAWTNTTSMVLLSDTTMILSTAGPTIQYVQTDIYTGVMVYTASSNRHRRSGSVSSFHFTENRLLAVGYPHVDPYLCAYPPYNVVWNFTGVDVSDCAPAIIYVIPDPPNSYGGWQYA